MVEPRIVSLIASATEMVAALEMDHLLVGRSHECDFPQTVQKLPVCSQPTIDIEGTSRQIDERVKTVLRKKEATQQALSVYQVFPDVLENLQPTVIITQTQCEVCAVSLQDVQQALCEQLASQPTIVSLEPHCLEDVWSDLRSIATALRVPERADKLIQESKKRLQEIEFLAQQSPHQPTVACLEWIDPLMAAGNWVPELVKQAGGQNLFGQAGQHSPWMEWDHLVQADPDFILLMPCGFDLIRTSQELDILHNQPGWKNLKAVRHQQVYLVDGNQYFNRPGPRLVESTEILAEIFSPEQFQFGHQGTGWLRAFDTVDY